jgi:hypothetical protein
MPCLPQDVRARKDKKGKIMKRHTKGECSQKAIAETTIASEWIEELKPNKEKGAK